MTESRKGLFRLTGQLTEQIRKNRQAVRDETYFKDRNLDELNIPQQYLSFDRYEQYLALIGQQKSASLLGLENPFFKEGDSVASNTISINSELFINFSSYNYLNLCGDPRVNTAAAMAAKKYGTSASASRMVSGERPIIQKLEQKLSNVYQSDEALTFVSGYGTNVTVIATLFGRDDLILYDEMSHNSILIGAKLSGATKIMFKHNNMEHLESLLTENRAKFQRSIIIVEGLYSMDGDKAPLAKLIVLKKNFKSFLMVDEAHGLGVLGKTGLGSFEAHGVDPHDVDVWMGTLSKTLAGSGGYIAGSRALITLLKYTSSGFVYSVGLSPALAGASLCALELMLKEPKRVQQLQDNANYFYKCATENKLVVGSATGHAIIPIMCKSSKKAVQLSQFLYSKGIYALPIIYPAVPENLARVRFFISSTHTTKQIKQCVLELCSFFKKS